MEVGAASAAVDRVGAGSSAMGVFAHSLNGKVLRAHANGALRTGDLEEMLPWAPQTSLRLAVSDMRKLGTLIKVEPADGARGAANELTASGDELLPIGISLESWLLRCPTGPLALAGDGGPSAVKALIGGWDSTIVRELSERPLTHTELCLEIPAHSYPAIGRRLRKLRAARLVLAMTLREDGIPYDVSDWLRHGVAPLSVAGRWERSHMVLPTSANARLDVEATFFLAMPLLALARGTTGVCTLAVLTSADGGAESERQVAGVTIGMKNGIVVSCVPSDDSEPATWALGTPDAWLEAVIEGRTDGLRLEGKNPGLPLQIIREMHKVLFPL